MCSSDLLRDRGKLQISARVRRIGRSDDGRYYAVAPHVKVPASEQLFVVMSVVNVGRRPVLWEGWGGKYHKREAEGTGFYIVAQNLPKMLHEGESHSEMTALVRLCCTIRISPFENASFTRDRILPSGSR